MGVINNIVNSFNFMNNDILITRNVNLEKDRVNLVPQFNFSVAFYDLLNIDIFRKELFKEYNSNIRIKSITIPEVRINTNTINFNNTDIRYPSDISSFEFTITFYNDVSLFAKKLYYLWLGRMIDRYNLKYPRKNYEFSLYIQIRDFNYKLLEVRRFNKCFPSNIGENTYDKEMKDYLDNISITFVCNGGIDFIYINNKKEK